MSQSIAHVTFLVRNYDEALTFFTESLGFQVLEDSSFSASQRWLLVAPGHSSGPALLLARAATADQQQLIGNQAGGRVFLFLHTDDFDRDYRRMQSHNVKFLESPRHEPYGTVAVFEDLYGKKWDLLQPAPRNSAPA